LSSGKLKKDFSNGNGFYLQDNLNSAIDWSLKMARLKEKMKRQTADLAERKANMYKLECLRNSVDEERLFAEEKLRMAEQRAKMLRREAKKKVFSSVLIYRFKRDDLERMNWVGQQNFDLSNFENWKKIVLFYR
jgi:hypothetical protein